jgi:phosphatidyl-myo-inositol alpha-mannosyltransferase
MRIGLFHCDLPQPDRKPPGVAIAVHRLANALAADARDRVTVFSLDQRPADAAYEHVRLFPRHAWLGRNKAARLLLLPAMLNFADFRDLDVLHLHGDDWFFVRRAARSVRTLHGSALREAQSASSLKRRVAQRVVYGFEHLSARLADWCMAVGDDAAKLYKADQIVNNGVEFSLFHPGEKSPEPMVLFVGTWQGRKRGEFLFRQFHMGVLPRVPSARLVMVSDHCDVAERVTWLKRPDDRTLADLYRQAWVFAYPSTYEGFGIPYVEAMASGTAVVASPNAGAAYVLRDGMDGRIVNDEAFAGAICDLLNEPPARKEYERRGLDRAAGFTWSAVAADHRRAYEQLLAGTIQTDRSPRLIARGDLSDEVLP